MSVKVRFIIVYRSNRLTSSRYHHGLSHHTQHEPSKPISIPHPTVSYTDTSTQGMLVGWGILSPISHNAGWAPGPVGSMSDGARGWILWTSLAIMCSDSVISLVPVMYTSVLKLVSGKKAAPEDDNEVETEDRLVSNKTVVWGLGVSVVVGTFIVWGLFGAEGIKPWATVVGFVMGGILSILG